MSLEIDLTKRLPRFTLDVKATLPGSGIHAITGPSGSGKSTLLRLVAGLEKPDSGHVRFMGETWAEPRAGVNLPPWRRPVGMVFQDFGLFPHLSLLDNVLFAAQDTFLAESLMRSLNIWVLRLAKPDKVSGGERQRCAICQALARKPGLLLLDEPFSALDRQTRRAMGALLRELADTLSIPMLMVTHDLEEALTLADSILTLDEGGAAPGWLKARIDQMAAEASRNSELYKTKFAEMGA